MTDFHKIWIDQCEAARDIREAFGLEKAIGYLSGPSRRIPRARAR